MTEKPCLICKTPARFYSTGRDGEDVECPRCGKFGISRQASFLIERAASPRQLANISGWLFEHHAELNDQYLSSNDLERLLMLPTPSFEERKRKLVHWLAKKSLKLGDSVDWKSDPTIISSGYLLDPDEVRFVMKTLLENGIIEKRFDQMPLERVEVFLTARGYDFLAEYDANPTSQIGFCAMWFDTSVSPLWEKAIEPAIINSGYQPLRIDKKEHVNRIDDEIFADIRRSRFVIADFTHGNSGIRGGVYFEAGFAQGLGLPVIWTCRKDMLSEDKLHFDIRQYNFLEWTDEGLDDFKNRLHKRIEAILGHGAWKS